MAGSKAEQMVTRLQDMQISSPEIIASALVSVDGLMIASALPNNIEADRVSAMTAAMLSLGERISLELSRGALNELYIRGQEGYVLVNAVGDDAVLTVMTREEAKLGLIFLEMRRAAVDLEKILA
jgi:predicted regulator of Ras-like GTPase activity (Roadblock/LC7/MglB family)